MTIDRYPTSLVYDALSIETDDLSFLANIPDYVGNGSIFEISDNLSFMPVTPPPPETEFEIAQLQAMLDTIPASVDRDTWFQVVCGVLDTGWFCAVELARTWSKSSPDYYEEQEFQNIVNWYDPKEAKRYKYSTVVFHAKQHGWIDINSSDVFDGKGADVKAGEFFANMHRNTLLFIHETGEALVYDEDLGWMKAPPGEVDRRAKQTLAKLRDKAAEAFKTADPDDNCPKRLTAFVERLSKIQNIRAMVDMGKSENGMTVSINEFDSDLMLLGVINGNIDLHNQKLLKPSPNTLVSKRCNTAYDPEAKCPVFMRFLSEVQPDDEIAAFLQVVIGYWLTGSVKEQKLLFFYGEGANGKSVLIELISWLLGDYSKKIATEMLMQHQRNPQGPSPDIVALKGVRLAYANETEEGKRLSEARVKDFTGGDTLVGRVMYGKSDIMFQPTHKLCIVGNHKPDINDNSHGMWRRIILLLFGVTIPETHRDADLLEKLKSEAPGILNWALEGLRRWQKNGIQIPTQVKLATAGYRDEQDIIGDWIHDHCDTGIGFKISKKKLYKAYKCWCIDNGHRPLAQGRLTRRLNERSYHLMPDRRTVSGLTLNKYGECDVQRLS